jgi:hypothetical protein
MGDKDPFQKWALKEPTMGYDVLCLLKLCGFNHTISLCLVSDKRTHGRKKYFQTNSRYIEV